MSCFITLHIGSQHNVGSCILDVLLSEITFNGVSIVKRFSTCVTSWHNCDLRPIKANSVNWIAEAFFFLYYCPTHVDKHFRVFKQCLISKVPVEKL